jgi:hypothetical protein
MKEIYEGKTFQKDTVKEIFSDATRQRFGHLSG